jgi:hypothetical protein
MDINNPFAKSTWETRIGRAATAPLLVGLAVTAMLMLTPLAASAAPRLHGPFNCEVVGEDQLHCTANVSGLGGATTARGILSADVVVITGCVTPSESNEPRGLQRTTTTVTEEVTVNVEGGRATFDITTDELDAEDLRDCPSANMTPVIVCATYSVIELRVIPNSGPSRTFEFDETVSSC